VGLSLLLAPRGANVVAATTAMKKKKKKSAREKHFRGSSSSRRRRRFLLIVRRPSRLILVVVFISPSPEVVVVVERRKTEKFRAVNIFAPTPSCAFQKVQTFALRGIQMLTRPLERAEKASTKKKSKFFFKRASPGRVERKAPFLTLRFN